MQPFEVRIMRESDLPGADELRQLVGWNQLIQDWRRLLRLEPEGCFVAVEEGAITGTVTTTCYGRTLAWIGMMLVHPGQRRKGIGTVLMRTALQHLRSAGVQCVRLDATPAGRPLYEKLGFVEEWDLRRWQRATTPEPPKQEEISSVTRPLRPDDWPEIERLDTAAFGTARIELLQSLAASSLSALVLPGANANGVRGWGLLRPGRNADYLGPLQCHTAEDCLALSTALLRSVPDRPVFWDFPELNIPARKTAQGLGFEPVRPLTRMRFGPLVCRSEPLRQFGIADPAVG